MENIIQTIDDRLKELEALKPLKAEHQQRLDRKIRLEFSYNSNHIEGNTLTYGETELLLIFDKTTGNHDLREYEEMKAHDVAFEWIKEWAADKERPLSQSGIRSLHEMLLVRPFWKEALTPDGEPTRRLIAVGSYKTQPNSVRLQNGEMFHYTSPEETPIQMQELIDWYNEEVQKGALHPVALAALLHYRFVRIHPFDDGNGRISRLLMNYVLLKNGLPPVVIRSADKRGYLFALNQADVGDINAFVNYVAEQLVWMLELSVKAAKGETLEEQDDLQKEITIWKKGILAQESAIRKSDSVIHDIYNKGLEKVIAEFAQSQKEFLELFHNAEFTVSANGFPLTNIGQFDLPLWLGSLQKAAILKLEGINFIVAQATFKEYKYDNNNPFDLVSSIKIQFELYRYVISIDEVILFNGKYNEYVTEKERNEIILRGLKRSYEALKSNIAKNK